jgi:hypothetical protein
MPASYLPHLADGVIASSPSAVITPSISAVPGAAWTFGGQPLTPETTIGSPPYFPFFTSTELDQLGGSEQANALATEQFWTRMITFLHHLAIHQPPTAGMPQER